MPIIQVEVAPGVIIPVDTGDQPHSSFGERAQETLFAGAQKAGAGLLNLPVTAGRGIKWALDKAGVPDKPGSMLSEFTKPNYLDEVAAGAETASREKGIQNRYGRATLEGLAGAPLMGMAGAGRASVAAGLPPAVAEGADALMGGTPEKPSWVKTPVAIGAGLLTGFGLGGKGSRAEADVREALKKTTPGQFSEAEKNSQLFRDAGIPSATVGEAFEPGSSIMTLAQRARAGSLQNPLRERTANREADLMAAGDEFKNRIRSEVDPNTVANQAGGAATQIELQAKRAQQNNITSNLAGRDMHPMDVADVYNNMLLAAGSAPRANVGQAYRQVAKALIGQDGKLLTNLQELSYAIRDLKTGMKNPLSPTFGDPSLDKAINVVDQAFRKKSPDYRKAMEEFAQDAGDRLTIRQGPVGSLADKNPLVAGQTPVSRLEGLVSGNSTATVKKTAQELASPLMTNGQPVAPLDIARALAQRKLSERPSDPGQAMRGNPGSEKEAGFNALLEAGGADVVRVNQPLRAADKLQAFAKPAGLNELPKMQWRQALLRPFRTLDMMLTAKNEHGVQEEIAKILARNDPKAVSDLQKLAMFDPSVRKSLSLLSAINAYSQTQGN